MDFVLGGAVVAVGFNNERSTRSCLIRRPYCDMGCVRGCYVVSGLGPISVRRHDARQKIGHRGRLARNDLAE